MKRFYRLLADPREAMRWYLKTPVDMSKNELDARIFTQALWYLGHSPLEVPLRRQGQLVDFNFGDFDMVVTLAEINAELELLSGIRIQRIPVHIESCSKNFEILNVLDLVKCVDKQNSEFTVWTENDARSDKVGKFRMITRLRIDTIAVPVW